MSLSGLKFEMILLKSLLSFFQSISGGRDLYCQSTSVFQLYRCFIKGQAPGKLAGFPARFDRLEEKFLFKKAVKFPKFYNVTPAVIVLNCKSVKTDTISMCIISIVQVCQSSLLGKSCKPSIISGKNRAFSWSILVGKQNHTALKHTGIYSLIGSVAQLSFSLLV